MATLLCALALASTATPSHRPACSRQLLRLRGGDASEQPKTGKLWTTNTFTRDHVRFMAELPNYLGAYIGPHSLPPKTIEAVMVTVNSINTCPYCTGLHGQLARMAKSKVDKGMPEVKFATVFAEEAGRGSKVRAAFDTLVKAIGKGNAVSVRALCWALLWGKTTGNTINSVRNKLLTLHWWRLTPFQLIMFVYYGPLFLVIGLLNAVLTILPTVPAFVSTALGAILWVPQALHLFVAGIVSLSLRLLIAPFVGLGKLVGLLPSGKETWVREGHGRWTKKTV